MIELMPQVPYRIVEGTRYTYWCGDKGVGIRTEVRVYNHNHLIGSADIEIQGLDEPAVEVSITTAEPAKHTFMTLGNDNWKGYVSDWVERSNLRQEWGQETIKYRETMAQVELPCGKASYYYDTPDPTAVYMLMMGVYQFHISAEVEVRYGGVLVRVSLLQEDDERENYLLLGEYGMPFPVNIGTIHKVVGTAVTEFMSKVKALLDMEPVGVDSEMYFT